MSNNDNALLPLVSIITATFNAAATLEACLASVAAQDYPALEHIIVDGASKDETLAIVKRHAAPNVRWISEPDSGIYDAWNKGIGLAKGQWIAFLGADDVLVPGAVTAYMQLAAEHPEAQYLSSQVRWMGPNGQPRIIGDPWSWPRFQRYMCIAHVGSMHRRDLFDLTGPYDTSLRIVADYELLLRPRGALKAAFLPRVTAQMQSGGTSDSFAAIEEAARVKIKTGKRHRLLTNFERLWARSVFRRQHRFALPPAKQ